MLRLAQAREEIGVVDDQWGRPTAAADLADAILSLIARLLSGDDRAAGFFHYAGSGDTCWAGFAEAIFEESARRGGPFAHVRRIPTSGYPSPARRPANSRLDTSKIESIGVRVRPWKEALGACLDELLGSASLRPDS
jgi:dTDP-4-dehydrorhamnose reductase